MTLDQIAPRSRVIIVGTVWHGQTVWWQRVERSGGRWLHTEQPALTSRVLLACRGCTKCRPTSTSPTTASPPCPPPPSRSRTSSAWTCNTTPSPLCQTPSTDWPVWRTSTSVTILWTSCRLRSVPRGVRVSMLLCCSLSASSPLWCDIILLFRDFVFLVAVREPGDT